MNTVSPRGPLHLASLCYGPPEGYPVLAIHGWQDNAASFALLAPLLSQGRRIVAVDLAGHGHSEHRPLGASYPLWDYAQDLLMLAAHLGWSKFAVLGHSMGASIGLLLAAAVPERITQLALIDGLLPRTTSASDMPRQLGQAWRKALRPPRTERCYASLAEMTQQRLRQGRFPLSFEAAQQLVARAAQPCAHGWCWRTDRRVRLPSPVRLASDDVDALLAAVTCPVRIVVADKGLLQAEEVPARLGHLPFSWHWVAGGHHVHLDTFDGAQQVADCFDSFLGKCSPYG